MRLWDRSHEPIFTETTVHYIFMWAAEGPIDVRKVADKLLAAGIAQTTGSPAYQEVRISPQLASLGRHLHRLERAKEVYDLRTRRDFIRWMSRNPRLAIEIARIARKRRKSSSPAKPSTSGNGIAEAEQQIKKIVWEAQSINAIQHAVESDLYAPAYL